MVRYIEGRRNKKKGKHLEKKKHPYKSGGRHRSIGFKRKDSEELVDEKN